MIEWHISSNLFMEGVDKNPEAGIALFVGLLAVTVSTFSNYINNKETNKRLEKQLRYDKEIETLLKLKQILDEISDNIPSEDFMSMRNDPVHYNAGTHKLYEFEKGLNFYRLPKIVRDKIESMTYGYKTEDMMITSLWSISKINYNKYRYTENLRDLNRCVKTILDK
ncbi:MAG: hypothetical protein LBM26_01615 [Methanobrevibacter sp.]|nr:hypothetical protein [Methanobrevibacter sp.]